MRPRLDDILAIARFELACHLRSRHTIVAGVMLVLCCVFGSWQLSDYADRITELGREVGPALDLVSGMIEGVTGLPVSAVRRLLEHHPPVLVALFALDLFLMPLLCTLLAYDQTATDIETKHVRYLLVRSDRASIYLGKTLGAWLLVMIAVSLGLIVVGGFLALRSSALEGFEGVVYLVRIGLTTGLLALPMVAVLGLISTLVGRARRALSVTLLVWVGVLIAAGLLARVHEDLALVRYLFPSAGRFGLLFDDFGELAEIIGYQLGYALVSGGAGLWWFGRRDL